MSQSVNNFSYSSESDDDAPGEVSLSDARNTKLSQVRSDRQHDKEVKEREREKRRNRNEMFTVQKKQKMESFGERALPEDVLEAVSADHRKLDQGIEEALDNMNDDGGDDSDDDSEEGSGSDLDNSEDDSDDGDFIALDSTTKKNSLNIVTVLDPKKNTSSIDKALAFRNNRLFSGPNAPRRCSAHKRRGLAEKKKVMLMK